MPVDTSPAPVPITSHFSAAREVDMTGLDAFIQQSTSKLWQAPMPEHLKFLLPKAGEVGWSVVDDHLAQQQGVPMSLSGLRRLVNKKVVQFAVNRSGDQSVEEVRSLLTPSTHEWYDVEGFVRTYRDLVEEPTSPVTYKREVQLWNIHKPFPILDWWELHRPGCLDCEQHLQSYGGSALLAIGHNEANPCYFADVMSWLSGSWRLPLAQVPAPRKLPNHASLFWSPSSVVPEVERTFEWKVLVPRRPQLVHPIMSVIRDGELDEALRILDKIGRPSPSARKEDIEIINEHIRTVLQEGPAVPPEIGILKPVKVSATIRTG